MAPDHVRVVAEAAVGDVGVWEERDDRSPGLWLPDRVDPPTLCELVGVRELYAFRRPGGSGRVDQRQQVIRPHRAPRRLEVEVLGRLVDLQLAEPRGALGSAVDDHQVLHLAALLGGRPCPVEEPGLDDEHPVAGVRQQVRDLLGGGGVVDRERRRPQVHRRGIDQVELGAIGEHEADRVAASHPERVKAAGETLHPLGVLREGDRDTVLNRPECDLPRSLFDRGLERLAHRRGIERARPDALRGPGIDCALHGSEPMPPGASKQPAVVACRALA